MAARPPWPAGRSRTSWLSTPWACGSSSSCWRAGRSGWPASCACSCPPAAPAARRAAPAAAAPPHVPQRQPAQAAAPPAEGRLRGTAMQSGEASAPTAAARRTGHQVTAEERGECVKLGRRVSRLPAHLPVSCSPIRPAPITLKLVTLLHAVQSRLWMVRRWRPTPAARRAAHAPSPRSAAPAAAPAAAPQLAQPSRLCRVPWPQQWDAVAAMVQTPPAHLQLRRGPGRRRLLRRRPLRPACCGWVCTSSRPPSSTFCLQPSRHGLA